MRTARTRRAIALAAAAAALTATSASGALAAQGDPLREGVRNGTTERETEVVGRIDASGGAKGGYVTRQSNLGSGARGGGAAIYGCRAGAASGASCLRGVNLGGGRAFAFSTTGPIGGIFEVGRGGDDAKPFTTNATGVATGLNADRVDGFDAQELIAEARRGLTGPAGPAGPQGPRGETGPPGPAAPQAEVPTARAISETQTFASGIGGSVTFARTDHDVGGLFDPDEPDRLTVPRTGVYTVTGEIHWPSAGGTVRLLSLSRVSGGAGRVVAGASQPPTGGVFETAQTVTAQVRLVAGEAIVLSAFQDSGSSLLIRESSATAPPALSLTWIAPGA